MSVLMGGRLREQNRTAQWTAHWEARWEAWLAYRSSRRTPERAEAATVSERVKAMRLRAEVIHAFAGALDVGSVTRRVTGGAGHHGSPQALYKALRDDARAQEPPYMTADPVALYAIASRNRWPSTMTPWQEIEGVAAMRER